MKKLYPVFSFKKVLILVLLFVTSFAVSFSQTEDVETISASTWTGNLSTDWLLAANWSSNTVPNATTDVTIPVRSNPPVISLLSASVNNLIIQSGASLTVNSELHIAGDVTNNGSLSAATGTIKMNGTIAQIIPAGLLAGNAVQSLTINNPAGVTLSGPLDITGDLKIENGSLTTGGFLTLKSTATSTAKVLEITSTAVNPIVGNVTVERYLPGKRAYRFLTASVNTTQSIRANWMENTNNPGVTVNNNPLSNYGTHITGPGGNANHFDATNTNNPSLFTFDNQTQAWLPVLTTDGSLKAGSAYRILVRGSRGVDLNNNNAVPSATTLRAIGTLLTGPVVLTKPSGAGTPGLAPLSTTINGYNLVGNPYASPVDWKKVRKNSIAKTLYYFDPTIAGSNQRGGYVSYNELYDTVSNMASKVNRYIQPGQAFFVQTTGSDPSITFDETDKTTTQALVFKSSSMLPRLSVQLLLPGQQNTGNAADGLAAYFSDEFSSSIGDEDSYKFSNQDENIAIVRDGQMLSMEGRKAVTTQDTVQLKVWQLTQKNYTLKIDLTNFYKNTEGSLEDAYLRTSTRIDNSTTTLVSFNITSDAGSLATDRFKIVFRSLATLPVKLTAIKAYEKNKGVQVEWAAESESNIDGYEVERSVNAKQFETIGSVKAKNISGVTTSYNYFDNKAIIGESYYRIKSIEKSGGVKYSEVVKAYIQSNSENITIASNPGSASFTINFINVEKGKYFVSVLNTFGQKVYEGSITHTGGSSNTSLHMNQAIPSGLYAVQIVNSNKLQIKEVLF